MPNPPTKGASARAPQSKPAVPRVTRLSTLAAASSKNLSDPKEVASSEHQHTQTIKVAADVARKSAHKEFSTSVTVRSPCLFRVHVLGFLRGVVPKKEIDHVKRHVVCWVESRSRDRSRD